MRFEIIGAKQAWWANRHLRFFEKKIISSNQKAAEAHTNTPTLVIKLFLQCCPVPVQKVCLHRQMALIKKRLKGIV